MASRKAPRALSPASIVLHGAADPKAHGDPVVPPIVPSANFIQEIGTDAGLKYARYLNTPNTERLSKRLAMLEGSEAALVLASGMGATACAMLALLRPGDHLLASQYIYGGTHRLFTEEFTALGIDVTLVDPFEPRAWRKRLRKETRAIFLESPVNPTTRVLDLRPISYLTQEIGLALVVDSTFASPVNFRPLEHGADVVIHSATKYLNGHHDVLGGVVCGTAPYIEEVLQKQIVWGQTPDAFSCWLLERGLKTLDVRVRRQNHNAARIANWCLDRKEIKRVHYPGLPDHPDHECARELMDGFGGMLAIELSGGAKAADKFLRKLRLVTHAASLGGVDTLVSEPRYSSHARLSTEQRARIGIPDGFLRISIGIEDADDLIADLEQALK
ncbi:MAG: aminotransferase class I/II-fold pyridoxal phosphate-dependent enzyme [Gemmatimonadaceae bacterium]|nr:aminotransferase class I/II-fold pyridoxal phosphate-dependent enzyme [Gemmatimonadaceae bacterium]